MGVQHLIELFRDITRTRTITLVNGHGNTYFTAQHTVALLLACMNKIVPHHNWMIEGDWRKGDADAISTPLRDRVIGLIGYGAVNQKVHHFLKPYSIKLCKISLPMEPLVREVPTTAMDLGENKQSSLLLSLLFVEQRLLELDFFLMDFLLFFGLATLINTPEF